MKQGIVLHISFMLTVGMLNRFYWFLHQGEFSILAQLVPNEAGQMAYSRGDLVHGQGCHVSLKPALIAVNGAASDIMGREGEPAAVLLCSCRACQRHTQMTNFCWHTSLTPPTTTESLWASCLNTGHSPSCQKSLRFHRGVISENLPASSKHFNWL